MLATGHAAVHRSVTKEAPAGFSPVCSPLKDLDEIDDFRKEVYVTPTSTAEAKREAGKSFATDPNKVEGEFRNYESNPRFERVRNFYDLQHKNQTLEYVESMELKYAKFGRMRMGIWEALEMLNTFVDDSDPDTDLSQMEHALQTAEAARKVHPGEEHDWLHLTALIHDMGKFLGAVYKEPQWAVVGDTFPVGMPFSQKNVFPQFFRNNPDNQNEQIQGNKFGIYSKHCGLEKVKMAWGHDEYLYRVCMHNKCTLPLAALYIIRYHSFYPWHAENAYMELCDGTDLEMLKWVKVFNKFDLYSKSDEPPSVEKLAPYYKKLIQKYFPEKLDW